jgi:hypothetical protein
MPATPPAAPPAPAAPASAPARILSGLDDKWSVHSRYPKVARLVVEDVPAGAQVSVACKGHGCPLKAKRVAVTGGKASLTRLFGSHRLKPGATIAIRVDAPSMTGRSVRFTIRAHRLPAKVVS